MTCLVPFAAMYVFLYGTRTAIARHCEVNDLPSRSEVLSSDFLPGLKNLIGEKRDRLLIERILEFEAPYRTNVTTIGVIYGAFHMRAVLDVLMSKPLGYHIVKTESLTVFEL